MDEAYLRCPGSDHSGCSMAADVFLREEPDEDEDDEKEDERDEEEDDGEEGYSE